MFNKPVRDDPSVDNFGALASEQPGAICSRVECRLLALYVAIDGNTVKKVRPQDPNLTALSRNRP